MAEEGERQRDERHRAHQIPGAAGVGGIEYARQEHGAAKGETQ